MATSAGLVSVTTGSLVVSGSLTSFVAAEGDQLVVRGITAIVARAVSPTQLQLTKPWPGPDITGTGEWEISLTGPSWQSTVVTNRRLTDLLSQFEAGPIKWDAQGPPSDRSKYNDAQIGFVFLALGDPWTLYTKIANTGSTSDWSSGQAIRGSPAESTVEAQAARDNALLSANQASLASSAAGSAASAASGSASGATAAAGVAQSSADSASASASTAAGQASLATSGAAMAISQAAAAAEKALYAASQAGAAYDARQAAETARDITVPAASLAQAAASATAQDRAQTGSDRAATSTAASIAQTAKADATAAAVEAAYLASLVGALTYDMGTLDQPSDGSANFDFGGL